MYLLICILHLYWLGYLYLKTSDFCNIKPKKLINYTIVDPSLITRFFNNFYLSTLDKYYLTKIEETYFTGYYLHLTKNGKINDIKAYFTNYYPYLIVNRRINAYNDYC